MTVEQPGVVDFASIDPVGNAVLTISDHLSWEDVNGHLFHLQEKINAYLRFRLWKAARIREIPRYR